MSKIFISYSEADRRLIEPIAKALQDLALDVFYDVRIPTGDSFDEVIATELDKAMAMLVCWSPHAVESKWVRSEAAYGDDQGILVACFVETCKLRPPYNIVQTENLASWSGAPNHVGWSKLIARIGDLVGRPALKALPSALGGSDPASIEEWARRFPDDPLAATRWTSLETALRNQIASLTAENLELKSRLATAKAGPDHPEQREPGVAHPMAGGYSRQAVRDYIGRFVCTRPAWSTPGMVYRYYIDIEWSDEDRCLKFQEAERVDPRYSHSGELWIPAASSFLYLVSKGNGWLRSALLSALDVHGAMRGVVTSLHKPTGAMLSPVCAPMVLERLDSTKDASIGTFSIDHPDNARYRQKVSEVVSEGFLRFVGP
jgi:hypothetical protein